MARKKRPSSPFEGRWHIVSMSTWDEHYETFPQGNVILHYAQPDSGTNHGTAMAMQVAELLGYTTRDHMRLVWGDSELAPPAPGWNSGLTTQLQGGALLNAAEKMKKDLVARAAAALKRIWPA